MLAYEAGATSVILEGGLRRSLNDDLDRCDELELTAINEQGPFMLIDAADTRIHGWEPEFSALPRNGLRRCGITGAVSARDVRFKRGEPSDPRGPRARAGSGLASSLGLDLTHPFGAGQLTCSAPHRFADVHFPNVANSQTIEIRAEVITGARAADESRDRGDAVALVGRKLGDTEDFARGFDSDGLDIAYAYMNVPRPYGIAFTSFVW